jgi:hypothetical protein
MGGYNMNNRIGDGRDSVPLTLDAVRPGDYLTAGFGPMGRVLRRGVIGRIPGFLVELPSGEISFISDGTACIMGLGV